VKRYQFRLDAVLRVRRIQEARARADLAMANMAVAATHQALNAKVAEYQMLPHPSGHQTAHEFFSAQHRLDRAAATVVSLDERRALARERAAQQHVEWSLTAQRVSALENLDERQHAEYTIDADRESEREIDDLVTSRHGRREEPAS
jgi:flagellar export protein FliJ